MKKYKFIFIILILAIIPGCWFLRVGVENVSDALFKQPQRIKNKIKDPIKDNVRLSALWAGHSTVLLQIDDKVILIDPIFEDVIAAVVLRRIEAGLDINDIPRLDIVLVSHAHMDHLSLASLEALDKKFPTAKLVFPKGAEYYMPSYDMEMIRMRTGNSPQRNYVGQSRVINGVKITTVFALHQGGRFGLDSYVWNVPGCTGYIIEYNGITIFYAGDTTYDDNAYKELGKKFNINLALIPVGPCRECETDGNFYHLASLGVLKVFDDLKAKFMIPVHYGSIRYFNDPDTPVIVLENLMKKYDSTLVTASGEVKEKPYSEKIKILNEGEQYIFEYK